MYDESVVHVSILLWEDLEIRISLKAVLTHLVISKGADFIRQTNAIINPSPQSTEKNQIVDQTYALVALAPNIALTIVKSSSFICATIVLGAKTPAAKSAPPNSVPAAYSETSDGIVCGCFVEKCSAEW